MHFLFVFSASLLIFMAIMWLNALLGMELELCIILSHLFCTMVGTLFGMFPTYFTIDILFYWVIIHGVWLLILLYLLVSFSDILKFQLYCCFLGTFACLDWQYAVLSSLVKCKIEVISSKM